MRGDTIVAIATPYGVGGVGIVRMSGPLANSIAAKITQSEKKIIPRYATFRRFYDPKGHLLDEGVLLYFPAPHSYTGEEVVELQGHSAPVVLDAIVAATVTWGARLAHPGEFTERAYLNHKIDLPQAEAVLDMIHASSLEAARAAARTLQGEFSKAITALVELVTRIRVGIEACLDFPEEDIDPLYKEELCARLAFLLENVKTVQARTQTGAVLREGCQLAIVGAPNVGKSSLLNALAGKSIAIVSDVPGTTRDKVHEVVVLQGVPFHITDTAGIRTTNCPIEQEGISRARGTAGEADVVLVVVDPMHDIANQIAALNLPQEIMQRVWVVINKIDLMNTPVSVTEIEGVLGISAVSAKTNTGLAEFAKDVLRKMNYESHSSEWSARRRHVEALNTAEECLKEAACAIENGDALEVAAEALRLAQVALQAVTGEFRADDLLGRIFSEFCIGK